MNEVNAVVRRTGDGCVWLETEGVSSCSRCKGGGCSSVSISRLFCSSSSREFRVECDQSLQVGDVVRLGLEEGEVLRAALLAYGLPLLGLIAGALAGSQLSGSGSELVSVICGFAGFVLALGAVRVLGAATARPQIMGKVSAPVIPIVRE